MNFSEVKEKVKGFFTKYKKPILIVGGAGVVYWLFFKKKILTE